jgi:hypothetical protein
MKKVDITTQDNILNPSRADFSARQKNIDFTFQDSITLNKIEFENCRFTLARSGITLEINNCKLKDVMIFGLPPEGGTISTVKFVQIEYGQTIKLSKTFGLIEFTNSTIDRLIDESAAEDVVFQFATISNFKILGEANYCTIKHSKFVPMTSTFPKSEVSIWNKKIFTTISSEKGIFGDIKLNPFYFATRCHNRKSIDLSQVTLIDDWSMLRKNYAGVRLWIVFLLTFAFFLPIIVHSYFLMLLGRTGLEITKNTTLWRVLLFGNGQGLEAFLHCTLTLLLMFYNSGRLWLTMNVSKLLEEQRFLNDSSFEVVAVHPDKLVCQLQIHKLLNIFFWVSVTYTIYKLWTALLIQVPTEILPH